MPPPTKPTRRPPPTRPARPVQKPTKPVKHAPPLNTAANDPRQRVTPNKDLRPGKLTFNELLNRTRANWAQQDWARANAHGAPFRGDKGLVYSTTLKVVKPSMTPWGLRFQTVTTDPIEFGRDPKGRYPRRYVQYIQLSRAFASTNINGEKTFQLYCSCFTGDTRVLTTDGWKTMFSLADHTKDPDKDYPVEYAINGKVHRGTVPWRTGRKPVWEVKLDNGYSFKATKDHPMLVYNGYDSKQVTYKKKGWKYPKPFRWMKVEDLTIGTMLVQNHTRTFAQTDKATQHYKESYLAGAFYGDGTYNPFSMCVKSHLEILDRLRAVDKDLFWRQDHGRYLFTQTAYEVFARMGMSKEARHQIPDNADTFAFLSGLIDTDGWVHTDNSVEISGRAQLRPLADKLTALGVHGVRFSIRSARERKGTHTNYGVRNHDQYALRISARGIREIRHNLWSIKVERIQDKVKTQNRVNTAKVISITYAGRQHVYDITVPGLERFVVESVIAHNCPRFKLFHHYVLWKNGHAPMPATTLGQQPPNKTNPHQRVGQCKHLILASLALRRMSLKNAIPAALPESGWRDMALYWKKVESQGMTPGEDDNPPNKIKRIAREVVQTGKAPRGTPVAQINRVKDFADNITPRRIRRKQ